MRIANGATAEVTLQPLVGTVIFSSSLSQEAWLSVNRLINTIQKS